MVGLLFVVVVLGGFCVRYEGFNSVDGLWGKLAEECA